jgi:hypothetical protein
MRTAALCVGFCLALTAHAFEREVKQAFAVAPGCAVNVDLYRGKITIEEGDAPEVRVTVRLETGVETEAEADRVFRTLQLDIKSLGNAVSVFARNPAETGMRFVWNDKNQIDLSCVVTVPRRCSVDLRTVAGAITVGSLAGRVVARMEQGNIFIRRIDGSIDARTQFGNVIVSRCSGATVLQTLQGTIRAGTIGGRASLRNTSGDIEVLSACAGVTAFAEVGDATIGFPRDFTGDSEIRTFGGNINANIDPAANGVVKASSVWGRVQSDLPLVVETGGDGKSSLTGRLNEGGHVLTLHANGGEVKIMPGETSFD